MGWTLDPVRLSGSCNEPLVRRRSWLASGNVQPVSLSSFDPLTVFPQGRQAAEPLPHHKVGPSIPAWPSPAPGPLDVRLRFLLGHFSYTSCDPGAGKPLSQHSLLSVLLSVFPVVLPFVGASGHHAAGSETCFILLFPPFWPIGVLQSLLSSIIYSFSSLTSPYSSPPKRRRRSS